MKGKLAAVALAAGVLLAGCGDDGGGGGGTEEICDDINQVVDPLDAELTSALQEAGTAAALGDEAALAEATIKLDGVVGTVTGALRDGADRADDEVFAGALREFATELESLGATVLEGGQPDLAALGASADQVSEFCGTDLVG